MTPDQLPLAGLRVLELARALAGPFCSAMLADFGADVIKVEGTPDGDSTRAWPPFEGDDSLYYRSINRNKRCLAMDLRSDAAKAVLQRLVADADVVIENFRPGVMTALGLDPDELRQKYPSLLIVTVGAFGVTGPMRDDAGLDQVAQGLAGLMSITGTAASGPTRVGVPISDLVTGLTTAVGLLATLVDRVKTGRGHMVATSLLEATLGIMSFQAQRYITLGEVPEPQGNDHPLVTPYGAYPTSDGSVNIAAGTEAQFAALCAVLGAPEIASDPNFDAGRKRAGRRDELNAKLIPLTRSFTTATLIAELRRVGVPCGPIHDMAGVFNDPQVQAIEMIDTSVRDDGAAGVAVMRSPLRVDGQHLAVRRNPPALGEHTVEVLNEIGFGDRVAEWVESGAITIATTRSAEG